MEVENQLAECEKAGLIRCYTHEGREYLSIIKFHQRLRLMRRKFPKPPWESESLERNPMNRKEGNPVCQSDDGHMTVICQSDDGHPPLNSKLRTVDRISMERELTAIASELKTFGQLSDYAPESYKAKRLVQLKNRRHELRKILGVTA